MELLKIDWESYMKLWVLIFTCLSAATGFFILHWKWWLKKAWKKWYVHYRDNRNQWRTSLMDVQKMQIKNQEIIDKKVDTLVYEFSQNGGKNTLGKIEKILDNQAILSARQEADWYLDDNAIVKSNLEGHCIWVNLAYIKMSGFDTLSQALGTGAIRSIHPNDRKRVQEEFIESMRNENDFITNYTKINLRTKEEFPVTVQARIVRNAKGEAIESVAVIKKDLSN